MISVGVTLGDGNEKVRSFNNNIPSLALQVVAQGSYTVFLKSLPYQHSTLSCILI